MRAGSSKIKENQPASADQEATVFYRPERVAQILRVSRSKIPGHYLTLMLRRCFEK